MRRRNGPQKFSGRLQIGYSSGGADDGSVNLYFDDQESRERVFEARLDFTAWGKAIASRGEQPCVVELWGGDLIGATHEHKRENVFVPRSNNGPHSYRSDLHRDKKALHAFAREVLERFEVDGWRGYDADLINIHRHVESIGSDGDVYNVGFHRWTRNGEPALGVFAQRLHDAYNAGVIDEATLLTLIAFDEGEINATA